MGNQSFGIDSDVLEQISGEVQKFTDRGVEVGLVIGGGNIYR